MMHSAYGIRTFESDEATEWLDAFNEAPSSAALERALQVGERADVKTSLEALAAAEVLAAWCGRPAPEIPPTLTAWMLGRAAAVNLDSLEAARAAVDRILADSELRRTREEYGELAAWRGAVMDLRHRLGD